MEEPRAICSTQVLPKALILNFFSKMSENALEYMPDAILTKSPFQDAVLDKA